MEITLKQILVRLYIGLAVLVIVDAKIDVCIEGEVDPCSKGYSCRKDRDCVQEPCEFTCQKPSNLGESCVSSKQCYAANLKRDEVCDRFTCGCYQRTCQCASPNFQQVDDTCYAKIGQDCSQAPCLDVNAGCLLDVCLCMNGFYYDSVLDHCLPDRPYNETCAGPADGCSTHLAACRDSPSRCLCEPSYYFDSNENRCYPKVVFGASCTRANFDVCLSPNAVCNGNPKVCECPRDRVFNMAEEDCVIPVAYNTTCPKVTDICATTAASCASGRCLCADTHYRDISEDVCYPKVVLDGLCPRNKKDVCAVSDASCTKTGMMSFVCKCNSGFVNVSGACYPEVGYYGSCSFDDQCLTSNAECTNSSYCSCSAMGLTVYDVYTDSCIAANPSCSNIGPAGPFFAYTLNYPLAYTDGESCHWRITGPFMVKVVFLKPDIPSSEDCSGDSVTIFEAGKLVFRDCIMQKQVITYTSYSAPVDIYFISRNDGNAGKGVMVMAYPYYFGLI